MTMDFRTMEDALRYAEVLALDPAIYHLSLEGPGDLLLGDRQIRERIAQAHAAETRRA